MVLILKKNEPITGEMLRSLSKHDLALARLEMTWERRDRIKIWTKGAVDVARFWRGARIRHLAAVRREARWMRRSAVENMKVAHEVLLRRDPEELPKALPWLAAANKFDPKCGEVHRLRGEILYALGQPGEAHGAFADSLKLSPAAEQPGALLGRARASAALGRYGDAEEDLSLLLEQEPPPKSKELQMAERRYSEAVQVQRSSQAADEGDDGKGKKQKRRPPPKKQSIRGEHGEKLTHVQKAAVAILEGRTEHAVVQGDATFPHAHYLRGCCRVELKDWVGAEFDFEKYLGAAPPKMPHTSHSIPQERALEQQRAKALQCLACARAANRRWSQAVANLTEAILIDPNARRLCLLARIHCCERQWQLAADRYRDALHLDPNLEMAKVGLEQVKIPHEPLPLVTGLI